VADVPLEAKESFTPNLNKEHRDWCVAQRLRQKTTSLGALAACLWPSGCARMHWLQTLHELTPHVHNRSSRLQLRMRPHKLQALVQP